MTEGTASRVSSDETQTRQRKKRRWDQPAESLLAGAPVPGAGLTVPPVAPVPASLLSTGLAVPGGCATAPQVLLPPCIPQAGDVKLNQPKPQPQEDLVIAREIVINDAETSVRYKLTKRQTQEEIQNCTGAVVITRGKYRPPNAPADGEKPLYLHISAGAHLKEIAERILAVDHAAAMVEEMLKQGPNAQLSTFHPILSNGTKVTQALSTTVYLGFDVDPSLNIATRIRGPNDQYINHIMNETGVTVLLRGHGSGSSFDHEEEVQQPLHLLLSSNNPKSLEDAKRLAEHLLDTISVEFGVSRVSSHKVYGAVPPPEQLAVTQNSMNAVRQDTSDPALKEADGPIIAPVVSLITAPAVSSGSPLGLVAQSGIVPTSGHTQSTVVHHSQPALSRGTSYRGYEGIYPQATPLQQVALALRHSPSVTSTVAPVTAASSSASTSSTGSGSEKEKQPPLKRKFQELPLKTSGPARNQGSDFATGLEVLRSKAGVTDVGSGDVASFPPPKKIGPPSSNGMLPPPPSRSMPPPPPPPKFCSSSQPVNEELDKRNGFNGKRHDPVPDTLVKLMEYGDDDDDDPDDTNGESLDSKYTAMPVRKPFWAV